MTRKNNKFLIVSPHFPPINAADMHRIRTSLPYFKDYGWEPVVLTVSPKHVSGIIDNDLEKTVPPDIDVYKVRAFPEMIMKYTGITNLGLRAFPYLYFKGCRLIEELNIRFVYFSSTMFYTFLLGKMWKEKFNVPYVLDIQDPWYSDIDYKENFSNKLKYRLNRYIHKKLEQRTIPDTGGIITVSSDYINTLISRYPVISDRPHKTITFGVSEQDKEIAINSKFENRFFTTEGKKINGVYIGRGGNDMSTAVNIICGAIKKGLTSNSEIFQNLKLHFIGTSYSSTDGYKTIEPISVSYNVEQYIMESTERIPFFEALKLMSESDFIIVPGSNDKSYNASKIFPCIMSGKPLVIVFHKDSPVVEIIKETNSGYVVTFEDHNDIDSATESLLECLIELFNKMPHTPDTNWEEFQKYTAASLTKKQCELFDLVINNS